ncbi:MAG: LytTR family DNA-binding domain-containing protein [Prolixibacteraceae bacterium]|jgi:two-component system LytT family response regulator|nr:LytTR family DNA-binding domain-containing protein [Prolixibacteraceae bacterium]
MTVKAIIIDDEVNGRENLHGALKKYCTDVDVISEADSALIGIEQIQQYQPDLVFLDIEMPGGSGFKVLEFFDKADFGVIFVTAYDQYAIKAIRFSAIDYILKPINVIELKNAVDRFKNSQNELSNSLLNQFKLNDSRELSAKKIALPTAEKIVFKEIKSILRCEGEVNYTCFYFSDETKMLISKTLIEFEEILVPYGFIRTHKTHLVNLMHVIAFNKNDGCSLTLSNGSTIPVSRRRKEFVLEQLK